MVFDQPYPDPTLLKGWIRIRSISDWIRNNAVFTQVRVHLLAGLPAGHHCQTFRGQERQAADYPGSTACRDPFEIVRYFMRWVTTSWKYNRLNAFRKYKGCLTCISVIIN